MLGGNTRKLIRSADRSLGLVLYPSPAEALYLPRGFPGTERKIQKILKNQLFFLHLNRSSAISAKKKSEYKNELSGHVDSDVLFDNY